MTTCHEVHSPSSLQIPNICIPVDIPPHFQICEYAICNLIYFVKLSPSQGTVKLASQYWQISLEGKSEAN